MCQGLLEGYLLTGRHGVFTCYEAFIHIVDSMFNQHAKWLEACNEVPWRQPVASLNYLLSSHVWRQDHNGNTHQDPGFLDVVMNKKPAGRAGLPPAGRQHAAVDLRPLPALPPVRERRGGRQAAAARLAVGRRRRPALRTRARHVGVGRHRRRHRGARRRDGLRGRRPDPGDARGGVDPARAAPGAACPGRQRRRPHAAAARVRASPRPARPRVRHALHRRHPGDLRLPRLPLADPPAHLPPHQPRAASTCAATRRTAPRRRRSTWSC